MERPVPVIPARGETVRLVIDSDTKAEIDDLYAVALALLSPDRFSIEGFVGAPFDADHGGPGSPARSAAEIRVLIEKACLSGRFPVYEGAEPMRYSRAPSHSEGVEFIVDRAMSSTPEDPLWIVGLGAATDLASALLIRPEIAGRINAFWHFRTHWPEKCTNYNVHGDPHAARILFHTPVPFVLFDTGTYLTAPFEETERMVRPYGPLGAYLHEYRRRRPGFMAPTKGFFDLGDIAALLEPDAACWEETECPEVGPDLAYRFSGRLGRILRCYHIDRDRAFGLLYERLRERFG